MVSANDYGTADSQSQLVPSALTVYRHFAIDTLTRRITPMNYNPDTYTGQKTLYKRGVNRAVCARYGWWYADASTPDSHDSPDADCTCGFYAHYDPSTDFYPSTYWGREYMTLYGRPEYRNVVIVRGVAEVTGKVVCGRLGVRAEKLEIKALAVDWAKYQGARDQRYQVEPYDVGGYLPPYSSGSGWAKYLREPEYRVVSTDEMERRDVKAHARHIAEAHDVLFYEDPSLMYAAWPKPDLSALGITEEKAPSYRDTFAMWSAQAAAYVPTPPPPSLKHWGKIKGQSATLAILDEAGVEITKVAVKDIDIDPIEPETVKEKALRLKRNRPAPPGSGIDRRRGRLR